MEDDREMFALEGKVELLEPIVKALKASSSISEKLAIVSSQAVLDEFMNLPSDIRSFLAELNSECEFIIKVLLRIGQGSLLFDRTEPLENKFDLLKLLLAHLAEVEEFYAFMGGLTGYYCCVLKLLVAKQEDVLLKPNNEHFLHHPGIDLHQDTLDKRRFIRTGIESLSSLAAILPVGGAGDRLDLRGEASGEALPAAYLPMGGRTLLEGLIRDFQSMEFLYCKFFDKQLTIPIAMMTSHEKNNDEHIASTCKENNYFGRPADSFRRFIQPLVPVITEKGGFSQSAPLVLKLKPGGHGVLWKLAAEEGVFKWFDTLGCKKLIVRQINNPVADTDGGILAFMGVGCKMDKAFGFASCDRLVNASEGMIVLCEKKGLSGFSYTTSNVEYTDFKAKGIQDAPKEKGSPYSSYPANTNILFADLKAIQMLVEEVAVPGMMINMKSKVPHIDKNGVVIEVYGGRLESMMQNISDSIVSHFSEKLAQDAVEKLRCYVTYGERKKVISVTKNRYDPDKSFLETPEGCFYDQMFNCRDLLTNFCQMEVPEMYSERDFISQGPSFIVRYHPALGPLYQIIAQKIQKGTLKEGAELILEVAELHCRGLTVDGSLCVMAENILGPLAEDGVIRYSEQNGKCELKNVKVVNRGIDRGARNSYWKNKIARHEQLKIVLHGNAEFYAADVCFEGGKCIEVHAGTRMEVTMQNGKLEYRSYKIANPTWQWKYSFDEKDAIVLSAMSENEEG